jgi:hypothetical protein
MQFFIQNQAVPRYAHTMVIDGHIPMLDMSFCPFKIIGMNNIIPIFLQKAANSAITFKMPFQSFSSSIPDFFYDIHSVIVSLSFHFFLSNILFTLPDMPPEAAQTFMQNGRMDILPCEEALLAERVIT